MRARSRMNNRGFLLIGTYMVMTVFLAYSGGLVLRTLHGHHFNQEIQDGYQSWNLAQAALAQLKADFDNFVINDVYTTQFSGDVASTIQWLDDLDATIRQNGALQLPYFVLEDRNGDNTISTNTLADTLNNSVDGSPSSPLCEGGLPTVPESATDCKAVGQAGGEPRAWITMITSGEDLNGNGSLDAGEDANANSVLDLGGPTDPRRVTMTAIATIGGITRRVESTYVVSPTSTSNPEAIFRYAYLMENQGWFSATSPDYFTILGDLHSNSNLEFTGKVQLLGDAQAAGAITGDPLEYSSNAFNTYNIKKWWSNNPARPTQQLIATGQPFRGFTEGIPRTGGAPGNPSWMTYSAPGQAWDHTSPAQTLTSNTAKVDIPWLGTLADYEAKALQAYNDRVADTVKKDWAIKGAVTSGTDSTWGNSNDNVRTINYVYDGNLGFDGVANTGDEGPLVLVGTDRDSAILLNGPLVVKNADVIMAGVIKGQGTIYVDRNLHIRGSDLEYAYPPRWLSLERCTNASQCGSPYGTLRETSCGAGSCSACRAAIGVMADNGTYTSNCSQP